MLNHNLIAQYRTVLCPPSSSDRTFKGDIYIYIPLTRRVIAGFCVTTVPVVILQQTDKTNIQGRQDLLGRPSGWAKEGGRIDKGGRVVQGAADAGVARRQQKGALLLHAVFFFEAFYFKYFTARRKKTSEGWVETKHKDL